MSQRVKRSRDELASLLTCQLCSDVLRDPHVSTQCSHTACYSCFAKHWTWGGSTNKCPICEKLSLPQTVLGPYPIVGDLNKAPRLQRDYALVSLLRKLFPRPAVDAEVQAHELELAAIIRKRPGDSRTVEDVEEDIGPQYLASYREFCPVMVIARRAGEGQDGEELKVQRPYVMVPWSAPVDVVRRYVVQHVLADGGPPRRAKMFCAGQLLHPQASLLSVHHTQWGDEALQKHGLLVLEASVS